MFTKAFSVFALAAAFASAYTTPKNGPLGNPIAKPGLNEAVPVGKEYTITWTPTTPQDGTVTLLLLRGPSENVQPLYPIVENIKNTGSYTWTPKADLVPDTSRYGIQLIVDADGQYQWSTQFGISNPSFSGSASGSASGSGSASASASGSSGSSGNTTASATATGSASSSARVASTGFPAGNSSIVTPTRSPSVPSSLRTEASATGASTSSRPATATGAAAALQAGGSLVMAGLGLAAALL